MDISNTPEQLAAHLAVTGGVPVTRFPPEPNGYLHVGHGKVCCQLRLLALLHQYSEGHTVSQRQSSPQMLSSHAHVLRARGHSVGRFVVTPEMPCHVYAEHHNHREALTCTPAQACFVDFGMAAQYGGSTILRFDDTNPEAEKQEFIDHIIDIVTWLGWKPAKVTPV